EAIAEEIEAEVAEETVEEVEEVEDTPQSSSTGGSTGGSYSPSSSSSTKKDTTKDTTKETSQFAGLSVDELQAKQQEEQTTLDGAKTNYLNALNGSHAELEATKTAQNDAQKAYTNALEEKEKGLGVEMDRIYTENFAAAEQKNAATEELSMTEADITAQDETINNCTTRISQLEGLKSSLQSQINSAKEGDSEAVTSAQSKIAEIDTQIAEEEAKKKASEEKKGQLETRKGELTTLIGEIDAKIAQLDADYQKIKDRVNELTQEPEIRAIFDAFSAAVSNHEAKRAELTASEKSKIDTAQANLSAIRKEMPIAQEKEDKAKYSNVAASYDKEFGETLAKNAENMWAGKEAQGLCLGGVSKSFGRSFIGSDGKGVGVPFASAYMAYYAFTNDPEGYKEATGGEMNEAQLRSARELSQKYKEIEVTEDELDTLPAGAVVIWEGSQQNKHGHISISLGDGREASDAVYKQTHKSYHHNADFHVFIPTV
ncbi:MAG: hypothetical protein IJW73_03065, partial [Candidatus Gastranaerophilales bacterium]|nr:hypothetical protein [Candidatus Gastranaerophilales bacterium]